MKVAALKSPGGLDKLLIETRPDPVAGPGELLVRVRASSLNFHDFAVVAGMIRAADGRIPMSDGSGDVVAVGAGVTGFKAGERGVELRLKLRLGLVDELAHRGARLFRHSTHLLNEYGEFAVGADVAGLGGLEVGTGGDRG